MVKTPDFKTTDGIHIESEIAPEEKRHVEKFPISDYFEEDYFKEKSIYYQAM